MRQHFMLLIMGILAVLSLQLGCAGNKTPAKNPGGKTVEDNLQKQNPVVLINLFEVPAENEQGFVDGWKSAADYLREQEGVISTALRKSLNPRARFQYVNIAVWNSPENFKAATRSEAFKPIRLKIKGTNAQGTPSLYCIVPLPEEKTPTKFHARYLTEDVVFLINPFENIPSGADEKFIAGWQAAESHLKQQKGYVATALHQSIVENTTFRFVNVAIWASAKDFQAAVSDEAFQQIGKKIPYNAYPSLYNIIAQ